MGDCVGVEDGDEVGNSVGCGVGGGMGGLAEPGISTRKLITSPPSLMSEIRIPVL